MKEENKEISFWRQNFLKNNEISEKEQLVYSYFLSITSSVFMKEDPKDLLIKFLITNQKGKETYR